MNQELSTGWADKINSSYNDAFSLLGQAGDYVLASCNRALECGKLLNAAKSEIGHGQWEKWMEENLRFSKEVAGRFMRKAKEYPSPLTELPIGIKCLSDFTVGPKSQEGQTRSSLTWLDHFTSLGMKLTGLINGQIEKSGGDIEAWPPEQREAAKKQLQPIVDLYNRF